MFIDRVTLKFRAGKGGNGVVAWRREKYIPKGGPAGGNGGKGASVYLQADAQLSSLEAFRNKMLIRADDGGQGGSSLMHGKNGKDLTLKIPTGTLVKDAATGVVLWDIVEDGQKVLLCQGGRGGRGNACFKTPTNRAPAECTPGLPGEEKEIEFELKLIADVGLVGFPNAGKSTFLSKVAHIPVKIGAYPFTTLRPNLAVVGRMTIADIPGIIEGASQNRGLGLEFLRHIERTRALIYVLDASGWEGRKPWDDYETLRREMKEFSPDLLTKPSIILLNKMDREESAANAEQFCLRFPRLKPYLICAEKGEGISKVVTKLETLISAV